MYYRLIEKNTRPYAAKYLKAIYVLSNDDAAEQYGCVPNGEIGISVVISGNGSILKHGEWMRQPAVSVYGLVKQVQFHRMSPHYREINLGFCPQHLQLFLKDRMYNLEQQNATDLSVLFPAAVTSELFERLSAALTDETILDVIESFLQSQLLAEETDKRVATAHELIVRNGMRNVNELSHLLNLSSTGLRNLFRENVGISPKDLMKIQRIKQALHTRRHDEESLTQLAYHLNYFDQSHFIRDFKDAIGLTPHQYFANRQLTFDFYNFGRWNVDSFAGIQLEQ